MRELLIMLAAGTALLGHQRDAAKEDLKKLQGQWTVKAIIHDGKDAKTEDKDSSTWTIKENKITYSETYPGHEVFQLDADKSPKTVEGRSFRETGREKESTIFKAIYKIEGETLTLCLDPSGKVYPPSFDSKAGTGFRLIRLTRTKE